MWRAFLISMNRNLRSLPSKAGNALPLRYDVTLANQLSGISVANDSLETQESNSATSIKPPLEENPYYAKYADKIKKAQDKEHASKGFVKQLKSSSGLKEEVKIEATVTNDEKLDQEVNKLKESTTKASSTSGNSIRSKKSLDDIVKLDLLQQKSKEEIIEIWQAYHSKRDCIFASIPREIYETLYETSKLYPNFILPVPRTTDESTSYEFFLVEFREHCCYVTPLAAYHLHKEMAPVCLTIYHYPELSESKGVVLMVGEYDTDKLSIIESQCLANQLQYYYTTKESVPKVSLHLFNREPQSFDHMRLIRHLEEGLLGSQSSVNLSQPD